MRAGTGCGAQAGPGLLRSGLSIAGLRVAGRRVALHTRLDHACVLSMPSTNCQLCIAIILQEVWADGGGDHSIIALLLIRSSG